jgi:hypothetical protein
MVEKKPNKPTTFNVSSMSGLVEEFDEKVVDVIREKTGLKTKRSNVINFLMEILLENFDGISLDDVVHNQSLKNALREALQKK